jgi:N-carbamoyl-L-amino-acid hydrolase
MEKSPVLFNEEMINLIQQAADKLGLTNRRILSGAGHDAMNLAQVVPTSMIFIPCEKGISHNEHENITSSDAAAGANVLLHAIIARANGLIQ